MRIFGALLQRDIKVLFSNFGSRMIDNVIVVSINVFLYRYLAPLLGMPAHLVAPSYIGSIMMPMVFIGFSLARNMMVDLHYSSVIEYKLTLPLPKKWLFASYIVSFMIEAALITIPLLTIGIFLLGDFYVPVAPHWFATPIVYACSLFFLGTFFLFLSFNYSYEWFEQNLWARRLSPMFCFSATFYVWHRIYAASPIFGGLALLNPFSYIAEGIRSGLLGNSEFIWVWYCIPALLFASILSILGLTVAIKKRIDPV